MQLKSQVFNIIILFMFRSFLFMILTESELNYIIERSTALVLAENILDRFRKKQQAQNNAGYFHIPILDLKNLSKYANGASVDDYEDENTGTEDEKENGQLANNNGTNQVRRGGFKEKQQRTIDDLIDYFERSKKLLSRADKKMVIYALEFFKEHGM